MSLSTNDWENWISMNKIMNLDASITLHTKMNSKQTQTTKLLGEKEPNFVSLGQKNNIYI